MKAAFLILTVLLPAASPVLNAAAPPAQKSDSSVDRGQPSGIVLDDDAAELTGSWVTSNKLPPLVGATYRHDNNTDRGHKRARFTPEIPAAGEYEVRLLYTASDNRASRVAVTVASADGETTVTLNQREPALVDRVPRALGVFRLDAGAKGYVEVSNADADGYVVVDGVQLVPVAIAREERAGTRRSGFVERPRPGIDSGEAARRAQMAAAVAVSPLAAKTAPAKGGDTTATRRSDEPVRLAPAASPAAVDGKSYDVVIVGGTGGGVVCAVRAAREGCTVLLVQHNGHVGGMMTNGLMQWDALYGGPRSPLFTELLGNIEEYYIATFGRDSPDHQRIRYTHEHYPIGWAEPHVAEREYNRLLAGEKNVTLLLDHYPTAVEREGAILRSVTLQARSKAELAANDSGTIVVRGATFVDATYEGDLFALSDVPYRVGREARDEYDEPHAGKALVNIDGGPPQSVIDEGLNIRAYGAHQGSVDPDSPFAADGAVQAYNYRFCVTSDPANRIPIPKPATYRREEYVDYGRKYIAAHADRAPNHKSHVNSPILPGENHAYPEADWPAREEIIRRHLDFGLGLMWFLQNDESIPPNRRETYRQWGLPKDEYVDNGHVPYEMYVREARRIVGRYVFTEHDGMLAREYARTPVHADSIAVTDWYMDSHSCTTDSRPGYQYDGKLILTNESRPAQIPYRSMLPQGVDNLLVPVCLAATHVAWGSIRLEPVYLQTGEAAGFATALARKHGTTPTGLDADLLVRTLVERQQLVSFFNDLKVTVDEPAVRGAQYFGTRGFFADYNARLDEPLSAALAQVWAEGLAELNQGTLDPHELAVRVHQAESRDSPPTERTRGEVIRQMWSLRSKP